MKVKKKVGRIQQTTKSEGSNGREIINWMNEMGDWLGAYTDGTNMKGKEREREEER